MLSDRTTITGFLDTEALNGFLNAADIGVWPKLPAVTIQQAMGTGLFVVLPRNEWVGHLITSDGLGFYVKAESGSSELGDAILRAAQSVAFDGAARQARSEANAWFSAAGIAAKVLSDNLAGPHRPDDPLTHPSW